MNKKVALVSLFQEDARGVPPLGLLYLATALEKNGIESLIIHQEASRIESIISEIINYNPDLTGMSVFTGYNNTSYARLSGLLKEKGFKIAWGNAHPSLLPEQVLKENFVDFVIIGEGEETIVDLVKKIDDIKSYPKISGIGFKNADGNIIINQKRPFINLDDYLIDWSLIDLEKYIIPYFSGRFKRTLLITTSRGCPYNCQFCYNLAFNNRRWRAHTPEKLIANLLPIINKYKIDAIRFLDDNFFVDKERAFKIVQGLGLPYFAEARVEYVDEKFVQKLKETKCLELMFGFESGSDRILKELIKKGTGTEAIIKAVQLLKGTGITVSGSFVLGFPTETEEEYFETMRFIIKLLEINNNLAFTVGWYLPYPGTGLYELAKNNGFIPPGNTKEWDKFNRWRRDYEMLWIKWDYKSAVKNSRNIINLLALCYKRNIPIFKTLIKKRIEKNNYSFPLDIMLLSYLRNLYLFDKNTGFFGRILKKFLTKIVRSQSAKIFNT